MEPKPHCTYERQLDLLKERGMRIDDDAAALALLERAGYCTLSGYSYLFRLPASDGSRADQFSPGTSISQVRALWEFDHRLRSTTFAAIQHVETYLRALLAYSLGAVDPMIHRKRELLSIDQPGAYPRWLEKLDRKIADSRERVHRPPPREARWCRSDLGRDGRSRLGKSLLPVQLCPAQRARTGRTTIPDQPAATEVVAARSEHRPQCLCASRPVLQPLLLAHAEASAR